VEATRYLDEQRLTGVRGVDLPLGGTNEPTIAINPLDPDNIAYASLFELRISTDGGASFGPAVLPTVPPTHLVCGDPSLSFDSQGRLFWTYLGCSQGLNGYDIFIAQIDPITGTILPGYPVNITGSPGVNMPALNGYYNDKAWLAADSYPGSPFADHLYVIWSQYRIGFINWRMQTTSSADHGQTWRAAQELSAQNGVEGFVHTPENTVASNGDVFVAYHSQPGTGPLFPIVPDGVSGKVFVVRSIDGGATYPQKKLAYQPGQADITWNVQIASGAVPGATFIWGGSGQPRILAHPDRPEIVYVVACDDPDNDHNSGDASNVYMAVSGDHGNSWSSPARIDHDPGFSFQIMPAAAIDRDTGCIVVRYYDNRRGLRNQNNHYLLDVLATRSTDGGVTFGPDGAINDFPFDPDPGAPIYDPGPPATTRIGEYNGVAVGGGQASAVWCGNRPYPPDPPVGQQIIFDALEGFCEQTVAVELEPGLGPTVTGLHLAQAYPNPAIPPGRPAEICFNLDRELHAALAVFDARGGAVRRLLDDTLPAGEHRVLWDGRDERGARVGSGVFYCRLTAGAWSESRKLVVLK